MTSPRKAVGHPTTGPEAGRHLPAAETAVLDVRDLRIELNLGATTVPVVQDVTFRVEPGQILGVVGESGSGKSITALSVMGMLPTAATATRGEIRYQGRDLLTLGEQEIMMLRGNELGMVFQDPMAFLNPLMTVGQQIREVLVLHGKPRRQARDRAIELLELVGVRDPHKRVNDYPHQFSGGMRQRVIIAIAVANDPKLLIADEPTTALDVTVQAGILRLLTRLRDELGTALVLITHDIGIVEQVCDSVLVMYAGRVVEGGRIPDVLGDPRHPYTRALMRSTPRLDLPSTPRLPAIPGQPPDVMSRPPGCSFHPRCPLVMARCFTDDPPLVDRGSTAPHHAACWASAEPLVISQRPDQLALHPEPVASEREVVLDIEDARISYQQGRSFWRSTAVPAVVDGVSLQVSAGQSVGLVGESGCGKSTLARTIVGLLPLASGRISIAGQQWATADADQRARLRRTVQMVFQDPYLSLNPRQTIRDIVAEPLIVHRLVARTRRPARVRELMGLVGLPPSLLDRYPYQLSGGQRQRVGIARALAMEPKLIIADEPVSALDVSVQAQIINLLADLRDDLGLACLVIAHDLSVVRHLCDEVAVMNGGRIVEHGSSEEVFTAPKDDYTRSLLAAARGSDRAVPVAAALLAGSGTE